MTESSTSVRFVPGMNRKHGFNSNRRISLFILLLFLLLLLVYARLVDIQIINSEIYQLAAKRQYESRVSLKPARGIIFDRKLNPLVTSVNSFSFAADPNMLDDKESVANMFASVFGKDPAYYLEKLNTRNTSFVWLERRVDEKQASKFDRISFSGVIKLNEPGRFFNYESLGAQVIGLTDIDNNGITGIELQYNDLLAGKDGYVTMQKDGLGRKRSAVEYPRVEPENGSNLVLTIDMNIQKIIEEEINGAVNANNADGAKCVVMSVKTGEVLGIYSTKGLDLVRSSADKLSVVTDLYEPGSTFKVVTAAASLEEGIQDRNDMIQIHGGEYRIYGLKIMDSHKSTSLTFQQVVEQSSNIGMIQVASKLGEKKFYRYARDFGFGNPTGFDFPGESKGVLKRPVDFTPVTLKFMSIGYEILVTALQMTNAFASIANDGVLMKPYLLKRIMTPDGSVSKELNPVVIREVVSKSTARTLSDLLYGVVERGTGVEAKINNIKIAGKTGTSQKLIEGKYSKSRYTSSFVGYFPADNPVIVISVIIDAPKSNEYYGGKVAAPVFKNIAEKIINLTGIIEYNNFANNSQENPAGTFLPETEENFVTQELNLSGFELGDAVRILTEKRVRYEIVDPVGSNVSPKNEFLVIGQEILAKEKTGTIQKMKLIVKPPVEVKLTTREVKMPDVVGSSLRKAIKLISLTGHEFTVKGHGKILHQIPSPGTILAPEQRIALYCEPFQLEVSVNKESY